MSGAVTVLDYLNGDCWQAVLNFVPINDIIRTENTSRRWQKMVLAYLERVRFAIAHPYLGDRLTNRNACLVILDEADISSFECWTKKLGTSVIYTYCATEQSLKINGENCPNLEAVMFLRLTDQILLSIQTENFKRLQRICFRSCESVSDCCVSQFVANNILEELEIHFNKQVTGQCLTSIQSKVLKSLVLNNCQALEFGHLFSAVDCFSELTKLVLTCVPKEIYKEIHLVLNRMPKLEDLQMFNFEMSNDNFFESVCQLSCLKDLSVMFNTTDENLETMTRCCQNLQSLDMGDSSAVTGRGVAAVCRNVGPRLTSLGIKHSQQLTDDDVVACIRSCPNLTYLDVSGSWQLTEELLPRAAAARRKLRVQPLPPLCLNIGSTELEASYDLGEYEELELEF